MKSHMKVLTLLLAVVMLLAGCSTTTTPPAGGTATTPPAGVNTPAAGTAAPVDTTVKGGEIVVGMKLEPVTMEPASCLNAPSSGRVVYNMYDGLVRTGPNGEIVPHLAESYEYSEDGTVIIFHLRKDVKFHNGDTMTADDVKYSFDRAIALAYNIEATGSITEVVVVDPYTVEVHMNGPSRSTLANIAESRYLLIVNAKAHQALGDNVTVDATGCGTGPFKFVSWTPGVEIVLEAFDDYFLGRPVLDRIRFKFIPEDSSMAIALETGDIDVAADLSLVDAPHLQENKALDVRIFASKWLMMLEMNTTKEPWNNENVRKAIASCINLEELILAVTQGTGVPHGSLTFKGSFGYPDYPLVEQDYDKAKEYLAAAGFPDGLTVTFNATEGTYKKIGEALQGMCKPVGINIEINLMDSAAVIPMAMDNKHDIIPQAGSGLGADADSELVDKVVSGSWGNWSRINEPRIDELMAAARYEQDDAKRKDMYLEVQQIVHDKCYIIPLFIASLGAGCNAKLANFAPMTNSLYNFYPMYWTEAK